MRFRHGVRLWVVKQAPFLRDFGLPTYSFVPSNSSFTPKMAKRTAPGPYAAAPIIQGKFDGTGIPDSLIYGRGTQVSGNFYPSFDSSQGSIVGLWKPESSQVSGRTYNECLWYGSGNNLLYYEHDTAKLVFKIGGTVSSKSGFSIVAGTLYFIVCRWDCDNTLNGTNYICISVNDVHSFSITSPLTSSAPSASLSLGSLPGTTAPSNSILEGFTYYRRVLFDGTYGVDAGNGDEINLIYASGTGKKPEDVTGASDICFQLPTDGLTGELTTGTGEAWSFPWSDNKLLNWGMWDDDDTPGAPDDWTNVNSATLADAATADQLYDTRSQKITVDAADEGIKQAFAVSAGENYKLEAWLKTGGANQGVDVRVRDVTGAADIVELTTDSSDYVPLETCFEVPAGCNSIEVYIESTDADSYDIHVGQVQVLENKVDNGGMEGVYDDEAGGGVGTVNVAPGWNAYSIETDGTDTLDKETTIKHSGASSQKIITGASGGGIDSDGVVFTTGKWYNVSLLLYGTGATQVFVRNDGATRFLEASTGTLPAAWSRFSWVVKATHDRHLRIYNATAGTVYVDDVSIIELDDVSITVTPASEANSTEDIGIRVDGLDTSLESITNIKLDKGKIKWGWTPRHKSSDMISFGELTPYIAEFYEDANNYIKVYWSAANEITLAYNAGGAGEQSNTWDTTTEFIADTDYQLYVEWISSEMKFGVDNSDKITITQTVEFSTAPSTAYMGSNQLETKQIDAIYKAPISGKTRLAKIGVVADTHMADADPNANRYYRDADEKLEDAVTVFNADTNLDFIIMLGDYIDGYNNADEPQALIDLAQIENVYDNLTDPRYYVVGNHDLEDITKTQFKSNTGAASGNLYYSFDINNLHVVVLDACFLEDGTDFNHSNWSTIGGWIPATERTWLTNDLANTLKDTIVFTHQMLSSADGGTYFINNSAAVRSILEDSGKVRWVVSGHGHEDTKTTVNGICYLVLEAMVEDAYPSNSYATIALYKNGPIVVNGYGKQTSYIYETE